MVLSVFLSQEFYSSILDLVKQKKIYPYEHISDSWKFKEEKSFIVCWQIKKLVVKIIRVLLKHGIDLKWKPWKMRMTCTLTVTLYCYLMCEKFRNHSIKYLGLYPRHYLNTPGLRWDKMLNMTKVEPELLSDADMYLYFEKGTRSVFYYISKRYVTANSKYLKSYDPNQESKSRYILDR